MDLNVHHDLKRWEEQIFLYNPSIKSAEKKKYVSGCLQNQLLHSKAVVKIQRMDSECESLMVSLKQRFLLLQDFLIPKKKQLNVSETQNALNDEDELNLSSESSDDEVLNTLMPRRKNEERQNLNSFKNEEKKEVQHDVASETSDSFLPLAVRKQSRERRLSYKSYSSSSTPRSRANQKKNYNKREQTVTTSGVVYTSEDMLEERQIDATPTLHIKIPSLHRDNVHYIILDSLNFARRVFDYRATAVKQQHERRSIYHSSKTSKSSRNMLKCSSGTALQQLNQQEQELGLSQLIQDVMNEACNDETIQATSALENINNNLINNYDMNDFSQSSQEYSFSQNSNLGFEPICSTTKTTKKSKKVRTNTKRTNQLKHNEPPKKRGRKPKQINETDTMQPQPPTKSNLAKYVELFANDCELLAGSTTPAASSTKSQPLVSSTTHNFEVVDQLQQPQSSSQPITYYIDGDWANGGACQLVSSNTLCGEERQRTTNDNEPFQEFVNYIDDNGNSANNVIATVLDCNHSLPVSIPRSIANFAFQNKNFHHQVVTHQIQHQSTVQNPLLPTINIQLPPLPNNISSAEPPPAHTHKEVVDLSLKSKDNVTVSTGYLTNLDNGNDICMPLDLSACGKYGKEQTSDTNFVTIDTQDEEFIRCLIEQSDFEVRDDGIRKGNENEISVFDNESSKTFKAASDMPILDFDAADLARLVENTGSTSIQEQSIFRDNIVGSDSTNNTDSNYVSMDDINNSAENTLHFADHSTKDIFNKLLDITPDNNFLNGANTKFMSVDDELSESVFDQCRVENSTMCEDLTTQKVEKKQACYSNSDKDDQEIENNTSSDQASSSTSLAVHFDTSKSTMGRSSSLESSTKTENSEKDSNESELNLKSRQSGLFISEVFLTTHEKHPHSELQDPESIEATSKNNNNKAETLIKGKENINNSSCYSLSINNEMEKNKTALHNNDHKKNDNTEHHVLNKSPDKFNENVVFSVAKITLSEDDNLYAIDSDFSSSRSCDLNERKSVEHFSNSYECASEDISLYNNQEEKIHNTEMTNAEQEITDASKYLQGHQVPMPEIEGSLCTDMSNQNLTLLELDSKLEDSLDYNEDLDDALSLATSCFASPNNERFEDSIVDIDMKETSEEIKEPKIQPNPSQFKYLNHFKIPKLNNPTDLSSENIINKPELEEMNLCNIVPTKSVAQPTIPHNVEQITRTVKNYLLLHLNTDADKMLAGEDFVNEATIEEQIILKVFGITCLPYLIDKCFDTTHCQLSHQLNDTEKVYQNLNTLDKIHVNVAYKILYNHSKLYEVYFNTFCNYYTNKNDRTKLLNMVNDCERFPEYAEFIIVIYEGLVKCGLNRINACRLILKRIRETNISTSIVEALVALIMKSDWTMFTDFIEKYTQDMYQFNFRIGILEHMAPTVLNSKSSHLKQVFGKCVQTLHRDDTALLLNSPNLIQCVALLTTST